MSTNKAMTVDERLKYLRVMRPRYAKADRRAKGALLDEMMEVTGYSRKHLIHRLKGNLQRKKRQGGRGRTYGADVDDALRVIYESFDYICAERLTPNLVWSS